MASIETEVAVMKEQIAEIKDDTDEIKALIKESVKPRLLEHDKDIATLKASCAEGLAKVDKHDDDIGAIKTDVAVLKNNWMILTSITAFVAGAVVFVIDHFLGG